LKNKCALEDVDELWAGMKVTRSHAAGGKIGGVHEPLSVAEFFECYPLELGALDSWLVLGCDFLRGAARKGHSERTNEHRCFSHDAPPLLAHECEPTSMKCQSANASMLSSV
jgi:hypothetical protein